ncbi:MAG: hypothetical protein PHH37_01290 [Paludibacter sp.]|nr:hypothetical protein [Paludibacter sp.]
MKTSKYILPALLLLSICGKAQTVDQNVTVEREYKPVIQDAGKINSVPAVIDPKVEKATAQYTDIDLPMAVGQNIHPLDAAELAHKARTIQRNAFVRIGLGSYWNNMIDFGMPVLKNKDMSLDLKLNHLATLSQDGHSKTDAAVMYNNYYKKMDFYAGMGLGREYLEYYGDNYNMNGDATDLSTLSTAGTTAYRELNLTRINRTAQSPKLQELADANTNDVFWRYNANIGIRSVPNIESTRYLADLKYKVFDSKNGLTENMFDTRLSYDTKNGKNRLGIDIEMQNMMYKTDISNVIINVWDSYSVFTMNPFYSFERDRWNVRLGVKSSFSFIHGRPFNPSPDISAEWKVIPKWFDIYGGIGGGYDVNTMDKMFGENRYLFSDLRVKDTYTPVNAYIGAKVKPVYNVLLDAYVSYRYIDNQYFFINKDYAATATVASSTDSILYTNRFNVIYSGASLVKAGIRANYNMRNLLNIQLKGAYNGWKTYDTSMAWNKPEFEADLSADYRVSRNLHVTSNIFFESERFAKLGDLTMRMSPKVDVNLGASYSYLNWLTMFAKVNNLLNNKYQDFYGYQVQGLNVMVGAAFSF